MLGVRKASLVAAVVGLATLAACGKSSKTSSTTSGQTTTTSAAATVMLRPTAKGTVLSDPSGMTLYRFDPERAGTIACSGGCATTWPPLTVAAGVTPVAPSGLSGALGTVNRPDGSRQVTYQGWPLYRYSNDHNPGDTNGDGIGGIWHAAMPGGPTAAGAGSSGSSGPSGPSGTTTTAYAKPGY